jgi:Ca2+-binding RTX toxin-like protein
MANLIVGDDGANVLGGTAGRDVIYGFDPEGPQGQVTSIAATRVAAGLTEPLFATSPPGDLSRLFVVEKQGLIKILDLENGGTLSTPFLDVSGEISIAGERGLLGLTFDPGFAENGYFYVNLINTAGDTEIRRYQVSATDPNQADPASETLIIEIDQPAATNHKAGWLGFGPDGYLYAALGDGGGANDPSGNGQNINTLLGKMLRLDVSADGFPADPNRNYSIPADNPFASGDGADEIYALGLRNPWRSSFDRGLGDFYIADVGQAEWEEVNIGALGANYGWKRYEGNELRFPDVPASGPLTFPIHTYDHSVGQSITGGYVYRGPSEGLQGHYFFGDFRSQKIFTLHFDGTNWVATDRTAQVNENVGTIGPISSFGEDGAGNLYVIDYGGEVFRLTPEVVSADQNDTLNGGNGDDLLFGGSGDDRLNAGTGDDELQGGDGADRLFGAAGRDVLVGGAGNDILDGQTGIDAAAGGAGDDKYNVDDEGDVVVEKAGEGVDTVYASAAYTLAAGSAVEHLRADAGSQGLVLSGNELANSIHGGAGGDTLNGMDGNDTLRGNDGADTLSGGLGRDILFGGAGADTFVFRSAAEAGNGALRDQIKDFEDGADLIDLSEFGVAFDFIGNAGFGGNAGELRAYNTGNNTYVAGDLDGNSIADFQIVLVGLHTLTETDFVL